LLNQQSGEQPSHPVVEHPDAFVNRMAHSIGFYAARTYLRFQNITHTTVKEANRQDQERTGQTALSDQSAQPSEQAIALTEEQNKPATRKAEEKLDDLVQRLSSLTTTVKFNVQRTVARAREDAEDLWAEAQNMRHHRHETLPQ
jgi:hypothetical protein